MANNRMWLKNARTGARLLLAKYYPMQGWYCFHDDIKERLNAALDDNAPEATMWGDNDWIIEYEQKAEPPK